MTGASECRTSARCRYVVISDAALSTSSMPSGFCWKLPRICANVCDQSLSCSWSCVGRPNISALTIAGSGLAKSLIRSISPCATTRSIRSLAMSRIWLRSRATRRR
jgi:hypothetical protein